jgi:hypothetical protein
MFFRLCSPRSAKLGLDLAAHLPEGVFGDADPIGLGDAFEPGGDVDAVAEDVVTLDQHIAEMDADAPFHSAVGGDCGVPLRRQVLQRQGAFDGADHGPKLDQEAVTGGLEDPPTVLRDKRISRDPMVAQGPRRARFVKPHQPTVADYVGREDCGETAGRGHGSGRPLVGLILNGADVSTTRLLPHVAGDTRRRERTETALLLNPVASGYARTRSVRAPGRIKCAFHAARPKTRDEALCTQSGALPTRL